MWPHFVHLFWRSIHGMPLLVSSNWASWSLGLAIFTFYECLAICFRGWQDVITRWKQNVGLGLLATAAGYLLLLATSIVITTYDEHHDSTGRWQAVVKEKNDLKALLQKRDEYVKTLEAQSCQACSPAPRRTSASATGPSTGGPWKLTPDQENDLRGYLKRNFADHKPPINGFQTVNDRDAEPLEFANALKAVFVNAGFSQNIPVMPSSRWTGNPAFFGVMVYVHTSSRVDPTKGTGDCQESSAPPEDALLLQGALRKVLKESEVRLCLQHEENALDLYWIIIGTRPRD